MTGIVPKGKNDKEPKTNGSKRGRAESSCDTSSLHELKIMVSDESACGGKSAWGFGVFLSSALLKALHEWSSSKAQYRRRCSDSQTDMISRRDDSRLSYPSYLSFLPPEQEAQWAWKTSCTEALQICTTVNRMSESESIETITKASAFLTRVFYVFSSHVRETMTAQALFSMVTLDLFKKPGICSS